MRNRRAAAKGFQTVSSGAGPASGATPGAKEILSPLSMEADLMAHMDRIIKCADPSAIGATVGREKSTVYALAGTGLVPLTWLPRFARFDPDPEFLTRCAAYLLAEAAALAALNQAHGVTTTLVRTYRKAIQGPLFPEDGR
jgi:hypothetical protein